MVADLMSIDELANPNGPRTYSFCSIAMGWIAHCDLNTEGLR
jgi:hypothetical protein